MQTMLLIALIILAALMGVLGVLIKGALWLLILAVVVLSGALFAGKLRGTAGR